MTFLTPKARALLGVSDDRFVVVLSPQVNPNLPMTQIAFVFRDRWWLPTNDNLMDGLCLFMDLMEMVGAQ